MRSSLSFPVISLALLVSATAAGETDWVLVLDRSESMIQNDPRNFRFDAQKIMVDLLSQGIEESNRLTLIRFAGTPEAVLEREAIAPGKLEALRKTISSDTPQGDTDIGAALALARKVVKPEGRASDVHVILLTDGVQAGKIPNLFGRLEAEKKAYHDLGLPIHAILLNDFSLPAQEQKERRRKMLYYDDSQLQRGEDLLRDLAAKTGGEAAQVRPGRRIEDILLELIGPYMPFHREAISRRLETLPTDRQLCLLLDKKGDDLKLRLGGEDLTLSLTRPRIINGAFQIMVSPYSNRTVVMLRPAPGGRWPEVVEILPGSSREPVVGDAFVVSNVRLSASSGLEAGGRSTELEEGLGAGIKTRVRQNEVYPLRFAVSVASDVSAEGLRAIQGVLERCVIHVVAEDKEGNSHQVSDLPAGKTAPGQESRLYFLPTVPSGGRFKVAKPFSLTLRASLQLREGGARRPIARAANRTFLVTPSPCEWIVQKRWQGEPESSAHTVQERDVELELGEEVRMEVQYHGVEAQRGVEVSGSIGRKDDSAAERMPFTPDASKENAGASQAFISGWILPPSPGDYRARVAVKSSTVEEAEIVLHVARDAFGDGEGLDLGRFFSGERVSIARSRTIRRGSAAATATYWEKSAASLLKARIARQDTGKSRIVVEEVPLTADPPKLGTEEIKVTYRGDVSGLGPGAYFVLWPEMRRPSGDPPGGACDRLEVREGAFSASLLDLEGKPISSEAGRFAFPAGSAIRGKVAPPASFPEGLVAELTAALTWAGKHQGQPMEARGTKEPDGTLAFSFNTKDIDAGPAKLHLRIEWSLSNVRHVVEKDWEVLLEPRALSIGLELINQEVYHGQRNATLSFRLRAMGGQSLEEQRDLLSVWKSRPASASIENASSLIQARLESDGAFLLGKIDLPRLEVGAHELLLSSPVAKLGQDVAAGFFKVLPCPFSAKLVKGFCEGDPRAALEPGSAPAKWDAEGAVWATIENGALEGEENLKVVSAELRWNGNKIDSKWFERESAFRSEALPLDDFESPAAVAVSFTDSSQRSYELPLGQLEVSPVLLRREVSWKKAPPPGLERGRFAIAQGEVQLRGGSRAERKAAGEALRAGKAPLLRVTPPSALENLVILPSEAGGEAGKSRLAFGDRLVFEATLRAGSGDAKGQILIEVLAGGDGVMETRTVSNEPASERLLVGRRNQQGALEPAEALPFVARGRLFLRIEDREGEEAKGHRIQVFQQEDGRAASVPLESVEGKELVWRPKKAGAYLVRAEASLASGLGWRAEEEVTLAPPLKLEWEAPGALRVDPGEKLPLSIIVRGPASLDWESFQRWFRLRPQVLADGGQPLLADFTPWENDQGAPPGRLLLKAFSVKPLTASAARAHVILEESLPPDAGEAVLDALDGDIIAGGGGLVIVESFEKGPESYLLRDLLAGFQVTKGSRPRLGYRTGGLPSGTGSPRSEISARVTGPGGEDSDLAVEALSPGLFVFTPHEVPSVGVYRVNVKMKGARQLDRKFAFEVVRGASDWAWFTAKTAAGAALAALIAFLGLSGLASMLDRRVIAERIDARRRKALLELDGEPEKGLSGEVRIHLANQTLGPFPLHGRQPAEQVERWVDQHFSMAPALFADPKRNKRRQRLIQGRLAEARLQLLLETERRLPVRAADICVREAEEGRGARLDAEVLRGIPTSRQEPQKVLLSLRLLDDGKLRVCAQSGRAATLSRGEDFHYNGWIGKSGSQIRASVKVTGVAEYCTLTIHWKN
jgi:hypothetical protein